MNPWAQGDGRLAISSGTQRGKERSQEVDGARTGQLREGHLEHRNPHPPSHCFPDFRGRQLSQIARTLGKKQIAWLGSSAHKIPGIGGRSGDDGTARRATTTSIGREEGQ